MILYRKKLVILPLLLVSSLVYASEHASQTTCTDPAGGEVRTVRLEYQTADNPLPCDLLYTKAGSTTSVASAKNTRGFCEDKERNIIGNLVAGGWSCTHEFTGALTPYDKNLELDLFGKNSVQVAQTQTLVEKPAFEPGSYADPKIIESVVKREKSALLNEFNELHLEQLKQEFLEKIQARVGEEYEVDIDLVLDLNLALVPVAPPEIIPENQNEELLEISQTETEESSITSIPENLAIEDDANEPEFLLISKPLESEVDAQRYAAQFRRIYPSVNTKVGANQQSDGQWFVLLGQSDDENSLQEGLAALDPSMRDYFNLTGRSEISGQQGFRYVPDDWARYVVAGCLADGKTSNMEIAQCSGFLLEADSFLSCLNGGVCVPEYFDQSVTPELVDFVTVIGSDDPVAAARGLLISDVAGCERLTDPSETEFAECVALAVMGDEHRLLYECHQRSSTTLDFLSCSGSDELSTNIALFERCSIDGRAATECVLNEVDNDFLVNASRCVNYEDSTAILSCAVESNLDVDQSRVLRCLQLSDGVDARTDCLAREYLSGEQAALFECSRSTDNVTEFGLCTAQKNGHLNREESLAAECLLAGAGNAQSLLDCAGGRFVGTEIAQCAASQTSLESCFDTETILTSVVDNTVDDFIDRAAFENEIAMFRSDIYALQGGDIAFLLASQTGQGFLAAVALTAKKVVKTVKKKSGGLLKKFGFGKKK